MKVCCDCKEEKPLDEFSLIWSKKPYLRSYCRKCNVIRAAKWAKANRGRATENSKLSYRRRYFVGRYKRKNITMTPHQKNDWREKFLKSPVMERLFAIELTAINTGRIEQWHGKTVQEELETLLTQQAERIAEERGTKASRLWIDVGRGYERRDLKVDIKNLNPHHYNFSEDVLIQGDFNAGYSQAKNDVLTLIRTRNT